MKAKKPKKASPNSQPQRALQKPQDWFPSGHETSTGEAIESSAAALAQAIDKYEVRMYEGRRENECGSYSIQLSACLRVICTRKTLLSLAKSKTADFAFLEPATLIVELAGGV